MKILFLTGSRGEWGYIRPVIAEAKRKYGYSPALDAWEDNNKPQKADNGPFVVEVSDVSDELRAALQKQRRRAQYEPP